jgi:hypothetical protein
MKIIVFAVFLSIVQTSAPIPRKTTNSGTGAAQKTKNQPDKQQKPPDTALDVKNKEQSPTDTNHAKNYSNQNTEQPVKITELPAVSVRESGFNWQGWTANALLLIVGGLQIWILFGTLKVTKTAADAAKASADAVVNGERAWLLEVHHGPPQIGMAYFSEVILKNFGKTPAKVIAFKIEIQRGRSKEIPDNAGIYEGEVDTLVPVMVPQDVTMPHIAYSDSPITSEQMEEIKDQRKFLWLCGAFRYEDIFRQEPSHETRFCYIFEDRNDGLLARWHMAGPPEYNRAT